MPIFPCVLPEKGSMPVATYGNLRKIRIRSEIFNSIIIVASGDEPGATILLSVFITHWARAIMGYAAGN